MKDIEFFSNNKYIVLPTKSNPKVYLVVDNNKIKSNSFKLYNPFSVKAKILKKIIFLFPFFNRLQNKKSEFIKFLENKFQKEFVSSVYMATDKDKIILQLQSDNKVFGYLKIATSVLGQEKIQNEIEAIELLKDINKIDIIDKDVFNGYDFFLSKEIIGNINFIENDNVLNILNRLRRDEYIDFASHPRVIYIKNSLISLNLNNYLNIFNKLNIKSQLELVYEHGDFTPWNIINNNGSYTLFDFEYFVKDGLEWFDYIKYSYQIETLINKNSNNLIIKNILLRLDVMNSMEIFILYILKEIVIKIKENKSTKQEDELLLILEKQI